MIFMNARNTRFLRPLNFSIGKKISNAGIHKIHNDQRQKTIVASATKYHLHCEKKKTKKEKTT